jgi:hypothetical protein
MIEGSSRVDVDFVEMQNGEEIEVGRGMMVHAPRAGEFIWLGPATKPCYKVIEVAYWVGDLLQGARQPRSGVYCVVEEFKDEVPGDCLRELLMDKVKSAILEESSNFDALKVTGDEKGTLSVLLDTEGEGGVRGVRTFDITIREIK